jgi:single-strand DNA-binding protein
LSSGFSLAFLQGKVASKPKSKTGYTRFELDVPEWISGKNGEEGRNKPNKIIVQVVGKAADNAAKLSMGDKITIQGIIEQYQYEVEGQKRRKLTAKAFKLRKTNTTDSQNVCVVQGRMGNDPEVKFWESGTCQVSFALAVDEWDSTEKKDVTSWIDVRLKGKRAEKAAELLSKGTSIILEGKMITDTWEKDGVKGSRTFVEAWDFRFVGGKKKGDGGGDDDGYDGTNDMPDFENDEMNRAYESGNGADYDDQHKGSGKPSDLDDEIPF